jgi:hypothetical protein
MYTNGTKVLIKLTDRKSAAARDLILNKWYEATYVERYSEYPFRGRKRFTGSTPAVHLIDERGDEVGLCLTWNQGCIEIKLKQENTMNTNTKAQALKELEELKERAKALEEILNKPDVPEVYQGVYLVPRIVGLKQWYISLSNGIGSTSGVEPSDVKYGTAYVDQGTAEKALKLNELQQKYRMAAAKDWGNEKPNWESGSRSKFVLQWYGNGVVLDTYVQTYYPYHFRTKEAATAFLASLSKADAKLLLMGLDA